MSKRKYVCVCIMSELKYMCVCSMRERKYVCLCVARTRACVCLAPDVKPVAEARERGPLPGTPGCSCA